VPRVKVGGKWKHLPYTKTGMKKAIDLKKTHKKCNENRGRLSQEELQNLRSERGAIVSRPKPTPLELKRIRDINSAIDVHVRSFVPPGSGHGEKGGPPKTAPWWRD